MNKREKEVMQSQLDDEKAVLKKLEANYSDALAEINGKIELLLARQDADMQHVIYQVEYQKALKTQVQGILDTLHANEFETISEYLAKSYEEGFLGAMYELQGQGIPLVLPIDQEQVVQAIQHETQLSESLYASLGKDIKQLNKQIASEISRGIASNQMYGEIARNIAGYAGIGKNKAMRIARTEAHRIQNNAIANAQKKAKARGANIVKVWSSALDAKTRTTHQRLDGQIREIEEPFEIDGHKAMQPSGFGIASEDINCRCRCNSKGRWALNAIETKHLGKMDSKTDEELKPLANKLHMSVDELRTYQDQIVPINAKSYEEFKREYNKLWHYQGSELQKQAEERIAKTKRVRSNVQKIKQSGGKETGGKYDKILIREEQAQSYYEKIRKQDDVKKIANSSGMTESEITQIKNHVFYNKHYKYDGEYELFSPDYDMAVAWKRLTEGKPEDRDILLLKHELLESQVEKMYNLTASEAHKMANSKYNWEKELYSLLENGEEDDLL